MTDNIKNTQTNNNKNGQRILTKCHTTGVVLPKFAYSSDGGPDRPLGTWTHLSPHPKQHLEQYNSFCRDQCCDQHTQTMLYQTEHLMLCMVMRPNGNHISILPCFINRIHTDHTHTATTMKDIREPQINAPTIITEDGGWFKLRKNRSTETSD